MPTFEFGDKVLLQNTSEQTNTFIAYTPQHAVSYIRPVCAIADYRVSREQLVRICPVAARKWSNDTHLPDGVRFVYAEFLAPERTYGVR